VARFLFLYIADFPAWAAAVSEPALRGKPLLIYRSGRVIAANAAARTLGVQGGWTLHKAQSLFPEVVSLPYRSVTTTLAWEDVVTALYRLTPCIEVVRPGSALLDLTPETAIAPLVRRWNAYGTTRAGAADDRTTAELAALCARPGILNCVMTGGSSDFLATVPVENLAPVGVGSHTLERLGWFGWHMVAQLKPLSQRQLAAQFPEGEVLFRYAQASSTGKVATFVPPPTISTHYAFEETVQEPHDVEPVLRLITETAWQQLQGRTTRMLTVQVQTSTGKLRRRRILREPAADLQALWHPAYHTLMSLLGAGVFIDRLEIELAGLAHPPAVQGNLFSPPGLRFKRCYALWTPGSPG
ncbi:MAG: hypothetical protein JOZ57_14055, partial [Abitibacteriaceae bacterium]|nr:hypothetical protein [Abditibacteriaceae bacterium]